MTSDGIDHSFGVATEKEVRELLIEVGLQANESGLAGFAVDQCFEDARKTLRKNRYERADIEQ